jgi:putative peptide zinc metalloprotease protein
VIPGKQDTLPSAALGWKGGGPIEVVPDDPDGIRAVEPFFEVRVALAPPEDAILTQLHTGIVRFSLPAEPLFFQGLRILQQVLQARLRI